MKDILIKFQNYKPIEIELDQIDVARKYKELVRKNSTELPIFRDPLSYNIDKFCYLINKAKTILGWDWLNKDYTNLEVITLLHKDIEKYVGGDSAGFCNIPEEHDNLIHELHYCIHAIQNNNDRGQWLQLEWFNDDGFLLPDDFNFKSKLEFGDVKLQNPYVGHNPLFVYQQNDYTSISQTCKFHDLVRPGINLVIKKYEIENFSMDECLQWFSTHGPEFVNRHGIEKIKHYVGLPVIGRVLNLDILEQIANAPKLTFEYIKVN